MAEKKPDKDLQEKLKEALSGLALVNLKQGPKDNYAFWSSQPVVQFGDDGSTAEVCIYGAQL